MTNMADYLDLQIGDDVFVAARHCPHTAPFLKWARGVPITWRDMITNHPEWVVWFWNNVPGKFCPEGAVDAQGNIFCINCRGCVDCLCSVDCINCEQCTNCVECTACTGCENLFGCAKCDNRKDFSVENPKPDATYKEIGYEVSAFIARMQEQHGVVAIIVAYDKVPPETGGFMWDGNPRLVYAMAKKYVVAQESLWASEVQNGRC